VTRFTVAVSLLLASTAHPSGPAAKGVRFNCGALGSPSATVQIGQLATKPSKRGLFQVAALPTPVATGVEIRVTDPNSNPLGDFSDYIAALTKTQEFELQNVMIYLGDEKHPRLTAQSISVSKNKWTLKRCAVSILGAHRSFAAASASSTQLPILLTPDRQQPIPLASILERTPSKPTP
jgi:hypothetical protein